MTWGGIKKGDAVIEVYGLGGSRETLRRTTADSVGAKWVTVGGRRYSAATGIAEYGWSLHTEEMLRDVRDRGEALRTILGANLHALETSTLLRIVALLPAEVRS